VRCSNRFDPDRPADVAARAVVHASVEVHKQLGPGLLESVYESCLAYELVSAGVQLTRQSWIPFTYKGHHEPRAFRIDLVVDRVLIVEVKAVPMLLPIHHAQLRTYLRLAKLRVGLLLNFNVRLMKDGIVRIAL